MIDNSIGAAVKAANLLGIKPVSYAGPWSFTEEIKEPKKIYNLLKKHKFRIVAYTGVDNYKEPFHTTLIKDKFKKYGLTLINVSADIEGTSSIKDVDKILSDIKTNLNKNVVYLLTTHDITHKNIKNISIIIDKVLEYKKDNLLEIKNMSDLLK